MEQVQRVVMVAMKGHPCTGKTTLARSIAAAHKWPLISLDDVFAPHKWSLISLDDASVQSDHQFESMCQIALTQLNLGIRVIIDSPLAQKDHLDRLLQLSASTKARLIVVECKPRDTYEWRHWAENRFEHHDSTRTGQWKQLLTWDDIEPLIEQPDASSDCDAKNFSKLVVDTTRYITKIRNSDLYRALHYLAGYEGTLSVDFSDWEGNTFRSIERGEEGEEKGGKGKGKGKGKEENHQRDVLGHVHRLTVRVDEKQQKCNNEVIRRCRACLGPISGVEYNCDGCDLSVHNYCAELPDNQEISPQNPPPFLRQLPREYAFPERKGSNLCETHKRDFDECSECLFKTTLQSGLLPTVVLHPCHEHPLCLSIYPISSNYKFRCRGCGDLGEHVSYNCSDCSLACHPSCAFLPHTYKSNAHRHLLALTPSVVDGTDELYCNNCEERRNSNHWVYYCKSCNFTCHLNCMAHRPNLAAYGPCANAE